VIERPQVSVIMPTWGHAAFIRRAIESLLGQSFTNWELIIVDDGSPDETGSVALPYLVDERVRYLHLPHNTGLGAALNAGLAEARADLIAYLPSDDVYHSEHLAELVATLDEQPSAVLAFSGIRHHYNRYSDGQIDAESLQLVQVMHRATSERWIERDELVTDDLGRMLWDRLSDDGRFVGTGRVTCEWVEHPDQLHTIMREPIGGINTYRSRFGVNEPLRFKTSVGNYIDEISRLAVFRDRPTTPRAANGLRILLVGELAYNPERILALEERGHELFGLWMPEPQSLNTVGPLPFGHVTDVPRDGWQQHVRRIRPDVIYALLNWQAVPFAYEVLRGNPGIPFVWHFKEGPFICIEKGTWPMLAALTEESDAAIFSSGEMLDWFETVLPGTGDPGRAMVLDGDLPKCEWMAPTRSRRLSEATEKFTPWSPADRSACTRTRWPLSRNRAFISTSTATSRTGYGATGSSRRVRWRRNICICIRWSIRTAGRRSSRSTTRVGCTSSSHAMADRSTGPTGTT
jgi:hypothetical protein